MNRTALVECQPMDARGFSHAGVTFIRQTSLFELGVYLAVDQVGREWRVSSLGASKRFGWIIYRGASAIDLPVGSVKSLFAAAEAIARGCTDMPNRRPVGTLRERFLARTIPEPNSGCLLWTGPANAKGYGLVHVDGRVMAAQRLAWIIANGAIPEGMLVCHWCDTPPCVRLDHLWLGTNDENMADMAAKGRSRTSRLAERRSA